VLGPVGEAGNPRCGIDTVDRRGEEAGRGVTRGAIERDLPSAGDAERRLGAQWPVDELVVRCDERQVDAFAGQRAKRQHRLQARGPAAGDQDAKRRVADQATGVPPIVAGALTTAARTASRAV
jgi:hypothetical protein